MGITAVNNTDDLCRSLTCPLTKRSKRASKRGLLNTTGRNLTYETASKRVCGLHSYTSYTTILRLVNRWRHLLILTVSSFVKVNSLMRKGPAITHHGEVSQVRLWQGCEHVKVIIWRSFIWSINHKPALVSTNNSQSENLQMSCNTWSRT